ncbi:uncharacterized protein LOC117181832 [Belonocnema kinseyi]|uniref:uncharacterized protein LOC117181832 n=1 Tax=Belonocnema kinseyi TaxID=2817044 RepID=UPI00143D0F55|nr:uncharacterized protein LOC117181832 [Belonocnema kinseyi]
MAIGFTDGNEETTSTRNSTSELPVYQTSAVNEIGTFTNITSHPSESTNVDSNIRGEVDSSLKNTKKSELVNSVGIFLKVAEMVFDIVSFVVIRESHYANSTPRICFSLVSSLGFTITGCLLALYAFGAFKKPCINVLPFEYLFCILWACAFMAASIFLLADSGNDFEGESGKALIYGFVSMLLYCLEACLNCKVMLKRKTESEVKRESIKLCDNCRWWNQPSSKAYNGTESRNNSDPNEHWTRFYDLNAISDGCIIIF